MRTFAIAASVAALALGLSGPAAADPDHHQIQPRGRDRHAEGQGVGKIQGARREIHRRQGQGRSLSELDALQGQGRARGAAARQRADAGAVQLEIRPARYPRVRSVRSALHPPRSEDAAEGDGRPTRCAPAQAARAEGYHRPCLLGQRLQADERQQEAGGT